MLTFNLKKLHSKKIQLKKNQSKQLSKILLLGFVTLGLSACNDNNNDEVVIITPPPPPAEYSYSVMVTNLTYAQPLSPIAVTLHGDNKMWSVGESASVALEKLAEGGDNNDFMTEENVLASASSEGVLLPGSANTITISTTDRLATNLTLATMLVNTNDAFSGLTGIDISSLALNEQKSWNLTVYDSGTELNDEAAGTMPGPADGGVGYDSVRNDVDFVAYHSGVVSQDDDLSSSVLTQAHRFDNPAIKLTIIRTK
jgi:hypothetical protein